MVVGKRKGECRAEFQVCWQEGRVVTAAVSHFRTNVRDVPANRPLTFVSANDGVGGEVTRDVGSECRGALGAVA